MVEIRNKGEGFNRRNPDLAAEAAERRAVREAIVKDALAGADDSPRGEGTTPLDFDSRQSQKGRLQSERGN